MTTERRIVDGKPPQVMSEEEVRLHRPLVEEEVVEPEVEETTSDQPLEKKVLGKDYGLIIAADECTYSYDGNSVSLVSSGPRLKNLFFDEDSGLLYYLKPNSSFVYQYFKKIASQEQNDFSSITSLNKEIVVHLSNEGKMDKGKIVNLKGETVYSDLERPINSVIFQDELYYVSSASFDAKGEKNYKFFKRNGEIIETAPGWYEGIAASEDKIYFGGRDKTIYSYDGNKVEEFNKTPFVIRTLHVVDDYLLAGGNNGDRVHSTICTFDLKKGSSRLIRRTKKFRMVYSLTPAPLDFIKELNRW